MICPNCNYVEKNTDIITCRVCGTRLIVGDVNENKVDANIRQVEVPKDNITDIQSYTVNGVSFNMIRVKGGTFMMGYHGPIHGSSSCPPLHQVTLDNFFIGEIPVTKELWNAVMGENAWVRNPIYPHQPDDISPLAAVSGLDWEQCKEFIDEISILTNTSFRFPTEAEWEFAARGGNLSRNCKYSGTNSLMKVGGQLFDPVKLGIPNELGIYDMSSTCNEWCYDWWHYNVKEPEVNPRWEYNNQINNPYDHVVRCARQPVWFRLYCSTKYDHPPLEVGLRLAI